MGKVVCLALHAINLQHSICQVAALAQPLLASRRRPLQLEADNTHPLRCHGPKVMHCSVCCYQYLLHAEYFCGGLLNAAPLCCLLLLPLQGWTADT
jgi:hypothetical protein